MSEECNVDDILCQMSVLQNLKGLQNGMGNESFKNEFPELEGFDEKLAARIETSTESIQATIAKCGHVAPEEVSEVSEESEMRVKVNAVIEPGELPEEK